MGTNFRRLSTRGLEVFQDFIDSGARGSIPIELISDPTTSEALPYQIQPDVRDFSDKYEFGIYLRNLLSEYDAQELSGDVGLWSAFALFWFEKFCPADKQGNRSPKEAYSYILSSDFRHYYRHLVRSPWQLVNDHGEVARLLLILPSKPDYPLGVHGEIFEQLGSRQQILRSTRILQIANTLYLDSVNNAPKRGVAGDGPGSARRFGAVLRQFELNYDAEYMSESAFIEILPDEFSRWRNPVATG